MNWDALIDETARRTGGKREDIARTLNVFFDVVIEKMGTDDVIQLRSDFGCFEMREAGGEKGPHRDTLYKCRRTPVFKKSKVLKKQLRQDDDAYLRMLLDAGQTEQADRLLQKRASERKD